MDQSVGNTAFSYLVARTTSDTGVYTSSIPPIRVAACRYWSDWHLIRVNAVSRDRTYGVYIYDGCNNDAQVYPVPTDTRQGSCNNDDNLFPQGKFSVCPIIEQGHVPAGLPFNNHCMALTEADTSLFADVSPQNYDSSKATTLTLTTSFASDMLQRLSEGTCSDVLDWRAVAWTVHWPDGATQRTGGSGQDGITLAHDMPATAQQGMQTSKVTVIAHLHVIGQALDFDQNGNTYVRNVDGYVDVSNDGTATGSGAAPVNEPPLLQVGAIPVGQDGEGNLPEPDPSATPVTRAVTIRGRLLALWMSPVVVRAGVEMVDGVQVGLATEQVIRWQYQGAATDTPPSEGTTPGAHGDASTPIVVQYDHAERTDPRGDPIDEVVPVEMTVRTAYPDGTTTDATLEGVIDVAIWYAGLT